LGRPGNESERYLFLHGVEHTRKSGGKKDDQYFVAKRHEKYEEPRQKRRHKTLELIRMINAELHHFQSETQHGL